MDIETNGAQVMTMDNWVYGPMFSQFRRWEVTFAHNSGTLTKRLKLASPFWKNVDPPKHVTCHVSCVFCHMSRVTCHISPFFLLLLFWTKWWSLLVEGLLSTGHTPSSLLTYSQGPFGFNPKQIYELITWG